MIYAKLLEFQRQNVTITKEATNPHFRSKYATLNEVLDKVKKPLNALGVVIVQRPDVVDGELSHLTAGLITELVDTEDGSKVEAFFPYTGATNAQQLGSANTYARRYSLITLLGLEDEDDDGNTASATSTPSAAPKAAQRPTAPVQQPIAADDVPTIDLNDLTF